MGYILMNTEMAKAILDGKMLNGKAQMEYYYDKYKIVKSDVLKKAREWKAKEKICN